MKKLLTLIIIVLLTVSSGFSQLLVGDSVKITADRMLPQLVGKVGVIEWIISSFSYDLYCVQLDEYEGGWRAYEEGTLERLPTPKRTQNQLLWLRWAKEANAGRLRVRYGTSIADKIAGGEIWIGMTTAMARESIGHWPPHINRTVTEYCTCGSQHGIRKQWVYPGRSLYFRDGILTQWQD